MIKIKGPAMAEPEKQTVTEWAWAIWDEETAHGPYPSPEAAIANAQAHVDDYPAGTKTTVVVGVCLYVDVRPLVYDDIDNYIDRLNDDILGDEYSFWDDEIFSIDPAKLEEAQAEYNALMEAWATKHIKAAKVWRIADDCLKHVLTSENLETEAVV